MDGSSTIEIIAAVALLVGIAAISLIHPLPHKKEKYAGGVWGTISANEETVIQTTASYLRNQGFSIKEIKRDRDKCKISWPLHPSASALIRTSYKSVRNLQGRVASAADSLEKTDELLVEVYVDKMKSKPCSTTKRSGINVLVRMKTRHFWSSDSAREYANKLSMRILTDIETSIERPELMRFPPGYKY